MVCLAKVYREASAHERETNRETKEETIKRELVFRELNDYLEDFRGSSIILSAIPDITEVQHQNGTWDLVFDDDLSKKVIKMNEIDTEFNASDQALLFSKLTITFFVEIYCHRNNHLMVHLTKNLRRILFLILY